MAYCTFLKTGLDKKIPKPLLDDLAVQAQIDAGKMAALEGVKKQHQASVNNNNQNMACKASAAFLALLPGAFHLSLHDGSSGFNAGQAGNALSGPIADEQRRNFQYKYEGHVLWGADTCYRLPAHRSAPSIGLHSLSVFRSC